MKVTVLDYTKLVYNGIADTVTIEINDHCLQCGAKRGKPYARQFTNNNDGTVRLISFWENPCGHIDEFSDMIAEHEAREQLKAIGFKL